MKGASIMATALLTAAASLALASLAQAADPEPAVRTSSAAAPPPAAPDPVLKAPTPKVQGAPAATKRAADPATGKAQDRIELDATQITGNRELPNVMYVVPWKRPDLGEFAGRPPKSLLDELLAPVDREVFRRQNRYFSALQPDAAVPAPVPDLLPGTAPAGGAAASPPGGPAAGDEK
jgi:hypothetical protein